MKRFLLVILFVFCSVNILTAAEKVKKAEKPTVSAKEVEKKDTKEAAETTEEVKKTEKPAVATKETAKAEETKKAEKLSKTAKEVEKKDAKVPAKAAEEKNLVEPKIEVKKIEKGIVIITVDGTEIYKSDIKKGIEYNMMQLKSVSKEEFSELVSTVESFMIDIALIDNETAKKGIKVSDEDFNKSYQTLIEQYYKTREKFLEVLVQKGMSEEAFKQNFREKLSRDAFFKQELEPKVIITDEEVKKFYDENQKMMIKPEAVNVSHILLRTDDEDAKKKAELEGYRKKIEKGEPFEKMAKNFSDCPSSRKEGSLGYILRGQTVPEFEKVAFNLEVGELSPVIKTQYGYHLIKVADKKPEMTIPLEEAKENIIAHLKQPKRKELFAEYIKVLRDKAEIKIYEDEKLIYEEIVPIKKQAKETDEGSKETDKDQAGKKEAPKEVETKKAAE
ncbi:MAG: peptidylprolyl isomerase [Candidatus Aureabacteria bacterium]|nr:peptidylprolyl isomerase [Candidatus Auribacterota bacterium]